MQIRQPVCFGVWFGAETRRQRVHRGAWIFASSVLWVLMMWCYGLSGGRVLKAGHRRRAGTSQETREANTKLPRSHSYRLLCCPSVLLGNWVHSKTRKTKHMHRMKKNIIWETKKYKLNTRKENKWAGSRTDRSPSLRWVEVWFMQRGASVRGGDSDPSIS